LFRTLTGGKQSGDSNFKKLLPI